MEGREISVEELMIELRKDMPFYESSGGGITLSGGEPIFQHAFALAVLKQCKSEGLHTAVDTTGSVPWSIFEKILPYTDLVLYDIKQVDTEKHRHLTGVPNETILANVSRIADSGVLMEIRMPVVPGINDDRETNLSLGIRRPLGAKASGSTMNRVNARDLPGALIHE